MSNNNFTQTWADASPLTAAELNTGLQTLTLDISNTTQLTSGSVSSQVLTSNGAGVAASFQAVSDPLGPFAIRNYGLSAAASSGTLKVTLTDASGATPSATSPVDIPYSSNNATSAGYQNRQVTGALSFTITASASLGFTSTATSRVFVYGINPGGVSKLAVSARSDLDAGAGVATTVMSASADSATVLYATAASTVMPRFLGWVEAAHNATGSWQTPTHVNVTNNAGLNISSTTLFDRSVTSSAARVGQVVKSGSCGLFTNAGASYVDITNLSVTISTTGRPVMAVLIPDGSSSSINVSALQTNSPFFQLLRSGTFVAQTKITSTTVSPTCIQFIDAPAAGTYTYKLQINANSGGNNFITNCKLLVFEL